MCITPDMKLREGLGMGHIQRVGYAGISSAPLQVQLILKELWRVMNQESIPEGIHLFARLSHCNSSWIESLRTPGKSWFFASGSVFDPRAVWFIRPPGPWRHTSVPCATADEYDPSRNDENESQAIWSTSAQNDCQATSIVTWFLARWGWRYSYW